MAALESTLDWRYRPKANLITRPTSTQGQKALEGALHSAQGTLTDTKTLYAYRYDNDGKLTTATVRALAPDGQESPAPPCAPPCARSDSKGRKIPQMPSFPPTTSSASPSTRPQAHSWILPHQRAALAARFRKRPKTPPIR
ncbi:hypothetical protein [Armatimonas sp.]|uniref:hypothetical protein n=1 Tax=Armatimonas sp. TaxID=1872638 RepID=UPI003752EF44